ncbi:MAG: RNA methyltransferase, partial [Corynebacterium matruchotii]
MSSLDFTEAFTERTPRIVKAAKLHRTAVRRKEGRFIVEGSNSVEAAVATGSATDVFITAEAAKRFADIVVAAGHMQVFVHPITAGAARSLADTATAPGIFAVCRPVLWRVGDALGRSPRLVTVAVGTNDPGNA